MKSEASLSPADFDYDLHNFSITLSSNAENIVRQKGSQTGSQKSSGKILEAMAHDSHVTIAQLAELCGIGTRAVQKNIDLLREQGLLRRVGADKGGYWDVI